MRLMKLKFRVPHCLGFSQVLAVAECLREGEEAGCSQEGFLSKHFRSSDLRERNLNLEVSNIVW